MMNKKLILIFTIFIVFAITIKVFGEYANKNNVLVILDSSYSMSEKINKIKKIDMAKSSLNEVLSSIPNSTNVGLRVYGHKTNFLMFGGCKASDLVVPILPNSKESIHSRLESVQPTGLTPITYSLRQAVEKDLNTIEGKKRIVLISDGGENCDISPCEYVMELVKTRPDIIIDVIGFDLDDEEAESQLKCTALVMSGKYYTAKNQSELNKSIRESLNFKAEVDGTILNKN